MNYVKLIIVLSMASPGCTVVRQGEAGVKRKLNSNVEGPGSVVFNPFTTKVIKLPVRTQNLEIASNLPSKEGLNIQSVMSILHRTKAYEAPDILEAIGSDYESAAMGEIIHSI